METYYRFLDDMVDPASGEVVAEVGEHIRKECDQGKRITALLDEYPNQWSVTKVANLINIADLTKELTPTDILDGLQEALTNRNKAHDQDEVDFWAEWLMRDADALLEVGNG